MKYKFREFKEVGRRRGNIPKATITKDGNINFNSAFIDYYLGQEFLYWGELFITYHYDSENSLIGLLFDGTWRKNSYKVRFSKKKNSATVNARAFLKFHKIQHKKSKVYIPEMGDEHGFFVIDLKQ